MDWTFKNMKRIMELSSYFLTFGLLMIIFGVVGIGSSMVWIFGAGFGASGLTLLAIVHRAGPPSDFREHVDSEGREY